VKKGSNLLQLFLYASLVSLVWLGGYVLLSELFSVKEEFQKEPSVSITPAVRLPETPGTIWSVLVVTDEEKEVTEFFFRYADFLSDKLVFVEVPVTTKAELETGGYEVLKVHNPELPELFMITDLCRIFSEETWCMAAEEVGVSLLGERPRECYVIDKSFYEGITEVRDGRREFKVPESVKETVIATAEHAVTDDTPEAELLYWESYSDVEDVYYKTLPGKASPEEYQPDITEFRRMAEEFRAGIFEE